MPSFLPLSDQAAMAYFPDEEAAFNFAAAVRRAKPPWLVDVVQAYKSVAVFFDMDRIAFAQASQQLQELVAAEPSPASATEARRLTTAPSQVPAWERELVAHRIPCCYELQLDLARVAEHLGLSTDEIIQLHAETEYTVYAIGFCPGFPYLGYLPEKLCGVPRLESPRPRLDAGSVGLTGRQTGIYTEARPGGWNIIGRTPLELVHVADGYFPLRTGDKVQFTRIDESEFHRLQGQRL